MPRLCASLCLLLLSAAVAAADGDAEHAASRPTTRPAATAPEDSASIDMRVDEILRRMSAHLASMQRFRLTAEATDDEVPEPGEPKVQYAKTVTIEVERPNHLHVVVDGDILHREIWCDGHTFTILDRDRNVFLSLEAAPTLDAMLEELHSRYDIDLPLGDMLFSDIYDGLRPRIRAARYLGLHRVGQRKCQHLGVSQDDIDWQIWIDQGETPLPRKLLITHKNEPEAPEYCAVITGWETPKRFSPETFAFRIPENAVRAEVEPQTPPRRQAHP